MHQISRYLFVVLSIASLIIGTTVVSCAANETLSLVASGKSDAHIVIDSNSVAMVKYAAEEFRDYVRKISGAELPIDEVGSDYKAPVDGSVRVFIGESAYTKSIGLDTAKLKCDGYYVQITPTTLVLAGRDEPVPYFETKSASGQYELKGSKFSDIGQTGSLFAVYHFFEKYCDTRWYWPGELGEVVPKSTNISAPVGRYSIEPSFEYRMYYAFDFNADPEAAKWYRRAGFGSTTDAMHPNHSAYKIYANSANHAQHPEWFALHKGRRDAVDLCWTEPGVVDEWVRLAKEYFRANPTAKMFAVMPEDGTGVCECARCQKLVDWSAPTEGNGSLGGNQLLSNILWPAVNEVAKRIRDEFPDKYIGCCAYSNYLKPPWTVEKFEPNVIVMLCAMTAFMYDSTYDNGMASFEQGWLGKGIKTFSTWDYNCTHMFQTGNNGAYTPYILPHMLAKRYSRLKGISRGGFFEAENAPTWVPSKLTHFGMDHINWYVLGKLSWDPTLNMDALLDDYCKHFYGPAASQMRHFWQLQEDQWTSRKDPLVWDGQCAGRWNHVYTPKVLRDMFKSFDEARALAAKSDDPNYLKRLDLIAGEYAFLRSCSIDEWKGLTKNSLHANGSFEKKKSGSVTGWYCSDGASDVTGNALSGKKSLKLLGCESYAVSEITKFNPAKDYVISVWYKTEGSGNPDQEPAWPRLSVLKVPDNKTAPQPIGSINPGKVANAAELAAHISRPGNDREWQRMYVVCRPGDFGQIKLRGAQGYTCWYDDVTIQELPDNWQQTAMGYPNYPGK